MTNRNQCCYIHDDVCCPAAATLELRWGVMGDEYTHACGVHCQQMLADENPKTIDVTPLADLRPRVTTDGMKGLSEDLLVEMCGFGGHVEAGAELVRRIGLVRKAGEAMLPYINSEEVDAMLDAGVGDDPVAAFKDVARPRTPTDV